MEHLSPGSKVIMTFAGMYPDRYKFGVGGACAAAVGQDWTAAGGHSCTAAVGHVCGTVVGQGVAVGAAHAVRSMISTSMIPTLKNCLWFVLSSDYF
jgi:hypothetical protein